MVLPLLVLILNLFLIWPLMDKTLPFSKFTAPLLPFLAGGREEILKFLIFGAYIFGPVSLYFYVWEITNRRLISLLAGLIYTLSASRFYDTVAVGDSAHLVSLTILPIVLIFNLRFLRNPTIGLLLVSAVGVALVALTSPFGLFTLLIFLGLLTYSEMLLGLGRFKMLSTLMILIAAAGLSSFWYHPSFVYKIFQAEHGEALVKLLLNLIPPSFFLVPVLGALSFLIFDRKPSLQAIFLSLSHFLVFFTLIYVAPSISTTYLPVPNRFLPEFYFSFSFFLAVVLVIIAEVLKTNPGVFLRLLPFIPKFPKEKKERVSPIFYGWISFLLSFLVISVFFVRPQFTNRLESSNQVLGAQLVRDGGGFSQIIGIVISSATVLILSTLKLSQKFAKGENG
ncbi:hypothetical protein M1545_00010 [Patescibacteria group bacterium]|nr:hypothetical protein [Patescibacteria group bacterium]